MEKCRSTETETEKMINMKLEIRNCIKYNDTISFAVFLEKSVSQLLIAIRQS